MAYSLLSFNICASARTRLIGKRICIIVYIYLSVYVSGLQVHINESMRSAYCNIQKLKFYKPRQEFWMPLYRILVRGKSEWPNSESETTFCCLLVFSSER